MSGSRGWSPALPDTASGYDRVLLSWNRDEAAGRLTQGFEDLLREAAATVPMRFRATMTELPECPDGYFIQPNVGKGIDLIAAFLGLGGAAVAIEPRTDGSCRFSFGRRPGDPKGLADLFLRVRIDARLLNGPFVMIFCHISEPSSRKAAGAIKPWLELHRGDKHFIQCRHAEALPAHDGRSHWARFMLSTSPVVRRHCNDADVEAHLFMSFRPPWEDVTLGQTLIVGRSA